MPENPNKLSQFWQELKQQRVVHVLIYENSCHCPRWHGVPEDKAEYVVGPWLEFDGETEKFNDQHSAKAN